MLLQLRFEYIGIAGDFYVGSGPDGCFFAGLAALVTF